MSGKLAPYRCIGPVGSEFWRVAVPSEVVVEVEMTHFDGDNPGRYAAPGVREMRRVSRKCRGRAVYPLVFISIETQ
ncbi:MAG: hypothetical protein OXN84_04055 [Albidovulum sp.]|nr:hypothetical protein [Albidovulum sp.]